jgi:RNA polymerase primary sigma factor
MKKLRFNEESVTNITDVFRMYLREVKQYQPLDPEEEFELSMRMVNGDQRAKDKIVKHNLRFVISVAKTYYSKTATLEDLVNEGNHGLLIACDNYDPTRGFKFISYAVWWIRRSIMMYLTNLDSVVRLPHHKTQVINKIKGSYNELTQKLSKEPTLGEMLNHLGNEYMQEDIMLFFNQEVVRLDKEYEDGGTVVDNWKDSTAPLADCSVNKTDAQVRINSVLSALNKQEKIVLVQLYGLNGENPETMDTISREMGLTKERVRQIKEKALKILRTKKEVKHIYS